MADAQELQERLLRALQRPGGRAANPQLRAELGWDEPLCARIRDGLVAQGRLVRLRGRGGGVALARREGHDPGVATETPRIRPKRGPTTRRRDMAETNGSGGRVQRDISIGGKEPDHTTRRLGRRAAAQGPAIEVGVPPVRNANFARVQNLVHDPAPRGAAGFVLAKGSKSSMRWGDGGTYRNSIGG